jgi:hypothetical protein
MVYAIVLLVFVGFAIAITMRPINIIALAMSVYVFEQWAQANSPFFATHASLVNYAFGVLSLYALACVALRGRNPLTPATSAMWVYLALICYATVSCLWALDRGLSFFLWKYHIPYVITFVGIVPLTIQDRDDLRHAFTMSLAFGTVVGVMLLAGTQVHAWGRTVEVTHGAAVVDPRTGKSMTRLAPLAVGDLGGQLAIIAMLMNYRGLARVWQYLRWAIVPLALAMIYRSGSRGQLIATILAVVMFLAFSRGTKQITGWIAAGVSTLLILGASVWAFLGYAANSGRWDLDKMQAQFTSTRLEYSFKLLDYWVNSTPVNWLFGLGSSSSYDPRIIGAYCHITVVEVLAELGFVGLLMFSAWGFLVGRDILRLYIMTQKSDVDRGVAVVISALFVYAVILSFKQGSFLTNTFLFSSGLMLCRHAAIMQVALRRESALERQQRWQAYYARLHKLYGQPSPQT